MDAVKSPFLGAAPDFDVRIVRIIPEKKQERMMEKC